MKMSGQKTLYRLCLHRPEVGFDYYWMWSDGAGLLRVWYHDAQHIASRELLYLQCCEKGKVTEIPLDAPYLTKEAERHLFGKT